MAESSTEAPVVLLIEDHLDSREMYSAVLSAAGFAVLEATDGAEALAVSAEQPPAVVVTDLRIPGPVSALDLCRRFRIAGVPVIAVTGVTTPADHDAIRAAGCAEVVVKPLLPDVLLDKVRQILAS